MIFFKRKEMKSSPGRATHEPRWRLLESVAPVLLQSLCRLRSQFQVEHGDLELSWQSRLRWRILEPE